MEGVKAFEVVNFVV